MINHSYGDTVHSRRQVKDPKFNHQLYINTQANFFYLQSLKNNIYFFYILYLFCFYRSSFSAYNFTSNPIKQKMIKLKKGLGFFFFLYAFFVLFCIQILALFVLITSELSKHEFIVTNLTFPSQTQLLRKCNHQCRKTTWRMKNFFCTK